MSKPKMQIINTNAHYFLYPFNMFLETQRQLGLSKIELWGSVPHIYIDHYGYENLNRISSELSGVGMRVSVFTPNPYKYTISAVECEKLRKYSLAYYKHCIDVAAELKIPLMCISPAGGCMDLSSKKAWSYCKNALVYLCKRASEKGVKLALSTVEPGESKVLNTLFELETMLCEVGSNLSAVLDIASMSKAGENIYQWFDVLGLCIAHVHFTDSRSLGRQVLGQDCFSIKRMINTLNECGYKGYLGKLLVDDRYIYKPIETDRNNFVTLNNH
jgi:protein FrlC